MISFKQKYIYIFLVSFLIVLFYSCKPSENYGSGKLNFSKDTVIFDTIFSQIGSITKQFKVYNNTKDDILIKSIYVENDAITNFRLNIDGFSANQRENFVIKAQDSMFVFVEITINPNDDNSPVEIKDAVKFITEDHIQDVKLIAWGQDIHLYIFEEIKINTWRNDKPYLIYGYALVDSGNTLTIEAGARIHFHNYLNYPASLEVRGTLIVNGTKDEPVLFQQARLDDLFEGYSYKDVPGQWGTIAFINPSKNNKINYAIIRNGASGFQIGHPKDTENPDVEISNVIIDNMSGTGIYAFGAKINAVNTIISNTGYEALGLYKGGEYSFIHCTIANYYNFFENFGSRKTPSLVVSNYINVPVYNEEGEIVLNDNNEIVFDYFEGDLKKLYFGNSIIYGDLDDEIIFADTNATQFNYNFDYCLIKISEDFDTSDTRFNTIYTEVDSLFLNIMERRYELDSLSSAQNKGSIDIANQVPADYNENNRLSDGKPDLGAYEFVE